MDMKTEKSRINPLLEYHQLPPFDEIQARHAVPAVTALISRCREGIEAIKTATESHWENVVGREERLLDELNRAWQPISHLHNVNATDEWREAYGETVVLLTDFYTELSQDEERYQAYQRLRDSDGFEDLTMAQKKAIENALRDFHWAPQRSTFSFMRPPKTPFWQTTTVSPG